MAPSVPEGKAPPPSFQSSCSHRPALMAFHDLVLSLDGEGGWSLHPGHRSLEAKQEAAAHAVAKGGADATEGGGTPTAPPSGSGKARGGDAEAVLQGMVQGKRRRQKGRGKRAAAPEAEQRAAQEAEEELGDGNEGFSGGPAGWLRAGLPAQHCLRLIGSSKIAKAQLASRGILPRGNQASLPSTIVLVARNSAAGLPACRAGDCPRAACMLKHPATTHLDTARGA